MGNRSLISVVEVDTADTQAPGQVGLVAEQKDNKTIAGLAIPPTVDSDGSELSGLVANVVGVAVANEDGTSPFTDSANLENVAAAVVTLPPDGGAFELPIIALGKKHFVAGYATD